MISVEGSEIRRAPRREPSERNFGLTIAVVLVAYSLYAFLRHGHVLVALIALAAISAILGMLTPQALHWPNLAWRRVGQLLQRIVGPIVLGVVFVLMVTPIALIMRLVGRDPLRRRIDRSAKSYWIRRDEQPSTDSWTRQF